MNGNPNFGKNSFKKMRKPIFIYLLVLLFAISYSCKEKGFPKPKNLLGEKEMVDILHDMHLAEAYSNHYRINSQPRKIESKDLYFSVLKKHGVADSTFANSIVYYSSMPKRYEKIYQQVVDRLNMLEEETNKQQEVNIQPER
jgi:hypothetical protein